MAVPHDSSAVLPAAVLLDMDGTLVDTEPYWMRAEREIVAAHGATWTHEDALGAVGQALLTTGTMLRDAGVPLEPAEIVAWLVARVNEQLREAVPWRSGVLELLEDLRAAQVPCAIVTMSYRSQAEVVADGAPAGTFTYLVTGDEVTQGKPHPEPYLVAAGLLGVPVEDCVAIEDSGPGHHVCARLGRPYPRRAQRGARAAAPGPQPGGVAQADRPRGARRGSCRARSWTCSLDR